MNIKVLQHHIDEGIQKNPFQCAVAKAIQDKFPGESYISVGIGIFIGPNTYVQPYEVNQFIVKFDNGSPVEPFEFELGDPVDLGV